jgi:hypothetical protein
MTPVTLPGGKPVTAEPGLTPRLPCTTVAPVLVTVVPARTRKFPAAPRGIAACPWQLVAVRVELAALVWDPEVLWGAVVIPAFDDGEAAPWVRPTTTDIISTAIATVAASDAVSFRFILSPIDS